MDSTLKQKGCNSSFFKVAHSDFFPTVLATRQGASGRPDNHHLSQTIKATATVVNYAHGIFPWYYGWKWHLTSVIFCQEKNMRQIPVEGQYTVSPIIFLKTEGHQRQGKSEKLSQKEPKKSWQLNVTVS